MFKYDLGIIGGMGSEATVELYKRIIDRPIHSCDQEHTRQPTASAMSTPRRILPKVPTTR